MVIVFFRGLSYVLTGSQEHHSFLCRKIVTYIRENSQEAVNYFIYNPRSVDSTHTSDIMRMRAFEIHLNNMQYLGSGIDSCATQVELIAAASLLQADICMYQVLNDKH